MYIYIYICICIYVCVCVYTYIYIYIYLFHRTAGQRLAYVKGVVCFTDTGNKIALLLRGDRLSYRSRLVHFILAIFYPPLK